MRVILSVLSLLMGVAAVGWLAKKQPATLLPAGPATASQLGALTVTPPQNSQMLQNQVKKSVEEAMHAPRPSDVNN